MSRLRLPLSLALAFAVVATALAPLLGALRDVVAGDSLPLCHQAGMQVDVASAPLPADREHPPARKAHCPLCILVFVASFAKKPAVAPAVLVATGEVTVPRIEPARHLLTTAAFLSRAPPTPA